MLLCMVSKFGDVYFLLAGIASVKNTFGLIVIRPKKHFWG